MKPAVVKIGGSLIGALALKSALAVAVRHGAVVAPGGGPFADGVRRAQHETGFSDVAAHRMAILAMEQTAHLFADLAPALAPCTTPADFARASAAGQASVWLPQAMALGADVAPSWDVTSDSLALWLAARIGAPRLVLLKSAARPARGGPEAWVAAGLVDRAFPERANAYAGEIVLVGDRSADALDAALAAPLRSAA